MAISNLLLQWCKTGNLIIGPAEPTYSHIDNEDYETTDDDWRDAIVLRLKQEKMHDVVVDLFNYDAPADVQIQLYLELTDLYNTAV
jgi:hypothetical protein